MKKIFVTLVLLISITFQHINAQSFQKSYGKVFENLNTDQQELYDILDLDIESVMVSGTFRNVNTFPEIAFYGTLSKLSKSGNINWYKGFLPSNYSPFDSFFISSLVKNTNGDIYAFGSFLSVSENSGYILMKFNAAGEVIFAKKVSDELAGLNCKMVMYNNQVYAIIGNKVVRFDLNGNIINAIQSSSIDFNDIHINSSGVLTLLGQFISSDPNVEINDGLTVFRLSEDLSFINGGIFYSSPDSLGSLFSYSINSDDNGAAVIGGESLYFSVDSENTLKWAKKIPNFEQLPASDSYGGINQIKRHSDGFLYFITNAFFSESDVVFQPTSALNDEENFQYYIAICKIDPSDGNLLNSKEVKQGFFDTTNLLSVSKFMIDSDQVYAAGSIRDFYGQYKLNYIHKSELDGLQCVENGRTTNLEDISQFISYLALPSDTFDTVELTSNSISMIEVTIPINLEDQSCPNALGIGDSMLTQFTLYPNPTSNLIFIESEFTVEKIKVYDQLGRLVSTIHQQSNNSFDVSNLSAGIYHLEFELDGLPIHKKLIKE
jgi:Secretion system C-terminal sorting domain